MNVVRDLPEPMWLASLCLSATPSPDRGLRSIVASRIFGAPGNLALLGVFLLGCAPVLLAGSVSIVDGTPYSSINPAVRLYTVYYSTGTPNSAKLPIVVYVHGGGWEKGGRNDATITPDTCADDQTIACWLADHGFVVYSIDYQLVITKAAGTDLTIAGPNQVSSRSYRFSNSDVGSNLVLPAALGWAAGGYVVKSVSEGVATLSSSAGVPGASRETYSLIQAGTWWPAQWQDCNCFLRYLGTNAGVNTPGDPNNIQIMGQSAGGHLALMMGMSGDTAFQGNCDHSSTRYTVRSVIAASPPADLNTLYPVSAGQDSIRNMLGCVPGTPVCSGVTAGASPVSYVARNLPFIATFSGSIDSTVPPSNPEELQIDFSLLRPHVLSPWTLYPGFGHPLDMFYGPTCALLQEPSPCGSSGIFFKDAVSYLQQHSKH